MGPIGLNVTSLRPMDVLAAKKELQNFHVAVGDGATVDVYMSTPSFRYLTRNPSLVIVKTVLAV